MSRYIAPAVCENVLKYRNQIALESFHCLKSQEVPLGFMRKGETRIYERGMIDKNLSHSSELGIVVTEDFNYELIA